MSELRQRIESVKAQAQAEIHHGLTWEIEYGGSYGVRLTGDLMREEGRGNYVAEEVGTQTGVFIAAHDPASVIAACDADLALLDEWSELEVADRSGLLGGYWGATVRNLRARYPEGSADE